jgi:hypothetical protein
MDVESFYQCLAYVQSIQHRGDGDGLSQWLPTLAGVVVGFALSLGASVVGRFWRERRRKQAIIAELEVVRAQAERTFKATAYFAFHYLNTPTERTHYSPAISIGLRLFDQLYPGVAHSFSTGQQERFQYLPGHVDSLNRGVDWVMEHLDKSSTGKFLDNLYLVMGSAVVLATNCRELIENSNARPDVVISPVEFAQQLGVSDEVIELAVRNV